VSLSILMWATYWFGLDASASDGTNLGWEVREFKVGLWISLM